MMYWGKCQWFRGESKKVELTNNLVRICWSSSIHPWLCMNEYVVHKLDPVQACFWGFPPIHGCTILEIGHHRRIRTFDLFWSSSPAVDSYVHNFFENNCWHEPVMFDTGIQERYIFFLCWSCYCYPMHRLAVILIGGRGKNGVVTTN